MIGRRIKRGGARTRPTGRELNASLELIEKLSRVSGGKGTTWTPAGPLLARDGSILRLGVTGAGGVDARDGDAFSGADVSDASLSFTSATQLRLQTWSTTFTGFNLSSGAIAGNALTIWALLLGAWVCIWEDCQTSN
jgi:hypothetical protein